MIETPALAWSIDWGLFGAILGVPLYLASRAARNASAWMRNAPGPQERLGAFCTLAAISGFAIGGFLHDPVRVSDACRQAGKPVVSCVIDHAIQSSLNPRAS
jgi:hypothetical protein